MIWCRLIGCLPRAVGAIFGLQTFQLGQALIWWQAWELRPSKLDALQRAAQVRRWLHDTEKPKPMADVMMHHYWHQVGKRGSLPITKVVTTLPWERSMHMKMNLSTGHQRDCMRVSLPLVQCKPDLVKLGQISAHVRVVQGWRWKRMKTPSLPCPASGMHC